MKCRGKSVNVEVCTWSSAFLDLPFHSIWNRNQKIYEVGVYECTLPTKALLLDVPMK